MDAIGALSDCCVLNGCESANRVVGKNIYEVAYNLRSTRLLIVGDLCLDRILLFLRLREVALLPAVHGANSSGCGIVQTNNQVQNNTGGTRDETEPQPGYLRKPILRISLSLRNLRCVAPRRHLFLSTPSRLLGGCPLKLMHPAAGRAGSVTCRPGYLAVALALVAFDVALAFITTSGTSNIMRRHTSNNAVSTQGDVKQYPSLPTTVKGILFDMDGTLTDSDTLHFQAYRETFLKVGGSLQVVCATERL